MLEFAQALAWPLASVVIVITLRSIVKMVISRKAEMNFSVKDWVKFGTKAAPTFEDEAQTAGANINPSETQEISEDSAAAEEALASPLESSEHESKAPRNEFFTTKDAAQLPDLFELFKSEGEPYQGDPDFWETFYVNRRREVGVGNYLNELRSLASGNPDWVWPLIFSAREHRSLHDLESSEIDFKNALIRSSSKNRRWVLNEGVRLYFYLGGYERALEFVHDQLHEDITDNERAAVLNTLSSECKDQGDKESYFIFKEMELTLSKVSNSDRFDLAYEYAEGDRFPTLAYYHYTNLGRAATDWPGPPNNLGVIAAQVGHDMQVDYYEKAVALDNRLAASNLAHKLVEAGFISAAEAVLSRVKDGEENAENFARAQAATLAARRKLDKERATLEAFVDTQFGRYRGVIMDAYRFLCREGPCIDSGAFTSADRSVQVFLSKEGAACRLPFGSVPLEGVLPKKGNCYFGAISSGGNILSAIDVRILIAPVNANLVRLIQWPRKLSRDEPINVIDLSRLSEGVLLEAQSDGSEKRLIDALTPEKQATDVRRSTA